MMLRFFVLFFFVLCTLCCKFLWIAHFWFSLQHLTPSLFIEVPGPSQKGERSYICVLWVSIVHLSTVWINAFSTIPTVWYFIPSFYYIWKESLNSDGHQFNQHSLNKESLNNDGHQFNQYQLNKESVNSDGHQFNQYQLNKESLNSHGHQCYQYQLKKESLNSDGDQCYQYQ